MVRMKFPDKIDTYAVFSFLFSLSRCVPVFLLFLPSLSQAANFRVSPIRLDFDEKTKSGIVTLINEGDESLRMQLSAAEWTQDGDGKDQYAGTEDITFFPKILVIEANSSRIIRVGRNMPPAGSEKTYRLFVEEIPKRDESKGATVTIAVRFGVPIFVEPVKPLAGGQIAGAGVEKGELRVVVNNTGNVHFLIRAVHVSGKNEGGEEVFSRELSGWYLLSGAKREYTTEIPEDVCAGLSNIDIKVKADKIDLETRVDVDKKRCLQ